MVKYSYKYLDDEWTRGYWKFICDNEDKDLAWYNLSSNPNITLDIIRNNPEKRWNWRYIAMHPNLTWDFIEKNLHKPWDWYYISMHSNITCEIIEQNPNDNCSGAMD